MVLPPRYNHKFHIHCNMGSGHRPISLPLSGQCGRVGWIRIRLPFGCTSLGRNQYHSTRQFCLYWSRHVSEILGDPNLLIISVWVSSFLSSSIPSVIDVPILARCLSLSFQFIRNHLEAVTARLQCVGEGTCGPFPRSAHWISILLCLTLFLQTVTASLDMQSRSGLYPAPLTTFISQGSFQGTSHALRCLRMKNGRWVWVVFSFACFFFSLVKGWVKFTLVVTNLPRCSCSLNNLTLSFEVIKRTGSLPLNGMLFLFR